LGRAAPADDPHAHSVVEHNIYRWAGLLLSELARIPVDAAGAKASERAVRLLDRLDRELGEGAG